MDWSKYPRVKKYIDETGFTIDEAYIQVENLVKKMEYDLERLERITRKDKEGK